MEFSLAVSMVMRCIDFFLNETSTTEIYTYLHTLTLHDALPIEGDATVDVNSDIHPTGWSRLAPKLAAKAVPTEAPRTCRVDHASPIRSEEHTSELQSLMRISYAVFCLKKKTITPLVFTHHDYKTTKHILQLT